MRLYRSENLNIYSVGKALVAEWEQGDLTFQTFQEEMTALKQVHQVQCSAYILSNLENFDLVLSKDQQEWARSTIFKPLEKQGMKNHCFSNFSDLEAQYSVLAIFETIELETKPYVFTNLDKALEWIKTTEQKKQQVSFNVHQNGDRVKLTIDADVTMLPRLLSDIQTIGDRKELFEEALPKMDDLTPRELEVFKLIVNGIKSKEIALRLFIEEGTVKAHRKSIVKKLNIKQSIDWYKLGRVFGYLRR